MKGYEIISLVILSFPVIILSWRTLFSVKSHGFYRFFSWECIIWIFNLNWDPEENSAMFRNARQHF